MNFFILFLIQFCMCVNTSEGEKRDYVYQRKYVEGNQVGTELYKAIFGPLVAIIFLTGATAILGVLGMGYLIYRLF